MIFRLKKLSQMNSQQLYQILHSQIQELYKEYQFVGMSREVYDEMILSFLEKGLYKIMHQTTIIKLDSSYFITYIRKNLNCYLKELSRDKDAFLEILSNYITFSLKEQTNGKDAIQELNKLSVFLNQISFETTPNFSVSLLQKNPLLKSIISVIVRDYIDRIQQEELDSLNLPEISLSFIEIYCMIDKILPTCQQNSKEKENSNEELVLLAQQGDLNARNELITRNLPFVRMIAKKYRYLGLPFDDLVQEGSFGLLSAIDEFCPDLGFAFTTYASFYIRHDITRSIENLGKSIRIPVYLQERLLKLKRAREKLSLESGDEERVDELSKVSGMSKRMISELDKLPVDTVSVEGLDPAHYLDMEYKASSTIRTIDERIADKHIYQTFRDLLYSCSLTSQELEVLLQLYGFVGEEKTQVEIAREMGITNEWVRRLEASAVCKLRLHPSIKEYAILMDNPTQAKKTIDLHQNQYQKYGWRAASTLKLLDEEKLDKKLAKSKTKVKCR